MASPFADEHFLTQLLSEAGGFAIGEAAARSIIPLGQEITNETWSLLPTMPLDAQTLGLLRRLQRIDEGRAHSEGRMTGYDSERLDLLTAATREPPGFSELIELRRRGLLTHDALRIGLLRSGVDERYVDELLDLVRVHLSPADLAMARQQQFIDEREAAARSALQGVDAADADLLFKLAGLPPGIGEGLALLRRGQIDEARFAQYVAEGHTKTKYTDDLLQLRWQPLSAAIAAEALVRERISEPQALEIAAKNGIGREDFLLWSNMIGRPIAIGEALTLVNRGQMTKPQFREVVARSDVRTEYVDQLYELRIKYPPLFQLNRLVSNGSIPDELARSIMLKEGYPVELVDALLHSAHKSKVAQHKDYSLAIIETLYESGLEDQQWAHDALRKIGYDDEEIANLLDLLEIRRVVSEITRAVGAIRSKYVAHSIERGEALGLLDTLLQNPDARNRLLAIWDTEREANVKRLTPSQIGQALRYSIISDDEAIGRWIELGYPQADAAVLAQIVHKHPNAAASHPIAD